MPGTLCISVAWVKCTRMKTAADKVEAKINSLPYEIRQHS